MDEQQFKQTLQHIAAEAVPEETDIWPALQAELQRRKRPLPKSSGLLLRLAGGGIALAAMAFLLFWLVSLSQISSAPAAVTAVPTSLNQPVPIATAVPEIIPVSQSDTQLTLPAHALTGQPPFAAEFALQPSSDLEQALAACVEIQWDFGDGTQANQPCPLPVAGSGLAASHTYEQPGTYYTRVQIMMDNARSAQSNTQTSVVALPQPPEPNAAIRYWGVWGLTLLMVIALAIWLRRRPRRHKIIGYALLGLLLITLVPPFSYVPDPMGLVWAQVGGHRYDPRLPFVNRFVISGDPTATLRPYLDGLVGQTGLDPLDPVQPLAHYAFEGVRTGRFATAVRVRMTYADDSTRIYDIPVYQPDTLFGFYQSGWWYDGLARLRAEHRELGGIPLAAGDTAVQLGTPHLITPHTQNQQLGNAYFGNWYAPSRSLDAQLPLVWSPDGDAFLSKTSENGERSELWLVPLADAEPDRLAHDVSQYAWTPDGAHIVYSSSHLNQEADRLFTPLFSVDRDGGQQRQLLQMENRNLPTLSNDGVWYEAEGMLWFMPFNGDEPQRIVDLPASVITGQGNWMDQRTFTQLSPDLQRVAYPCDWQGKADPLLGQLCLQDVDGRNWVKIPLDAQQMAVSWSPNGSRLAVVQWSITTDMPVQLTLLQRDGTIEHQINIAPNGEVAQPQWHPDSEQLFVQTFPFGGRRILLVDIAGGEILDLSQPRWDALFALHPTGEQLLLSNGRGGFWLSDIR